MPLPLIKVDGSRNPAEFMNNNSARSEITNRLGTLGLIELLGRSEKAAQLHSVVRSIDELVERDNSGHDPDSWESRGTWSMGSEALDPKTFFVHALSSSEGTVQDTHAGIEAPHNRGVHQRRRLRRRRRLDFRLAGASILEGRLDWAHRVLCCSHLQPLYR